MSLGFRGLRDEGSGLGLRLGEIDLGLGRAYEFRVSRASSLGLKLWFKVRSGRFRVRAGL